MILADTLTKAIRLAVAGGWKPNDVWQGYVRNMDTAGLLNLKDEQYGTLEEYYSIESLIFSHDFAACLWGDKLVEVHALSGWLGNEEISVTRRVVAWQYHLREMVIADDPLEYLAEHMPAGAKGGDE